MALLKDWIGWEGPYTAQQRRMEEQHQANMKRIESLLQTEQGQRLLSTARAAALDRGEGIYGGRGQADPRIDQISKLVSAADKTADEKLNKSLTSQAQLLSDELSETRKKEEHPLTGWSMPVSAGPKAKAGEMPTSKSAAEYFQAEDMGKAGRAGLEMVAGQADLIKAGRAAGEFFQAPRTYEQLGVESVDDMATLEEMQKVLPDRDMHQEYEADPEYMQKLMKLWREGKLNKQNLHKAFSAIQQRAKESLGIA